MEGRRRLWQDDESAFLCGRCRVEFTFPVTSKHHCRKCGLIFCAACSTSRLIVPRDLLVQRPANYLVKKGLVSNEDEFRAPQRVCDSCSHTLRGLQGELRALVSRCNIETTATLDKRMPNVPQIDFRLENELKNATRVLYQFRTTHSEEKIPMEMLGLAKGVVFLTVAKAGFIFSGRYGTGFVVSKLPGDSWSAPSAVAMTGMGWGMQIGGELSDLILILTSDSAVETFKSRGQVTIGAELGVSVGPVGRSIESDVTAGNKGAAHAFSYAVSRGLFVGASLEACAFVQRKEVNRAYYGEKVGASALLTEYPIPRGAEQLYQELDLVLFDGRVPPERATERVRRYSQNAREAAGGMAGCSPGGPGVGGGDRDREREGEGGDFSGAGSGAGMGYRDPPQLGRPPASSTHSAPASAFGAGSGSASGAVPGPGPHSSSFGSVDEGDTEEFGLGDH